MVNKTAYWWGDKDITELTREELLKALKYCGNEMEKIQLSRAKHVKFVTFIKSGMRGMEAFRRVYPEESQESWGSSEGNSTDGRKREVQQHTGNESAD